MLKPGQKAPAFKLQNQDDQTVSLKDFLGQKVIVFFYPKDNTPGCTKEAIGFSEALKGIEKQNAVVLGISKDSVKSHQNFIAKQDLKITLLSDPEGEVVDAYGAWREKKNYGKTYMGIVRSTFLIDEKGKIARIWDNVRVNGHVDEVTCSLSEQPA